MCFELTEEQRAIKATARKFAENEFPPVALEYDKKEEFPREIWKKCCELGFMGVYIDEEYGGPGLGYLDHAMISEEFWRVDPGIGTILLCAFGSEFILLYGRDEQKKKYLPPLCKGDAIMGMAITEPDNGSNVTAMRTSAKKSRGEYIINGSKTFITNGNIADYVIVFCRTNPEADRPSGRHSMILVETDRKGFRASKLLGKMGVRASDTSQLSFDDVKVPEENLVGTVEGNGFHQLMDTFNHTRIAVAAQGVGVAQGAFEKAIRYTGTREQFGQPISSFQATQLKIAEMATLIEAGRGLYYRSAWLLDRGKVKPELISMAKWFCAEAGVRVTGEALLMHGGYGYFEEYDVERFYRAAKLTEIVEGTKDIEKLIVARHLLKKMQG